MGLARSYIEWWRKRFFTALLLKFVVGLAVGFALGSYFVSSM